MFKNRNLHTLLLFSERIPPKPVVWPWGQQQVRTCSTEIPKDQVHPLIGLMDGSYLLSMTLLSTVTCLLQMVTLHLSSMELGRGEGGSEGGRNK